MGSTRFPPFATPSRVARAFITAGSTVVTLLFIALGWWVDKRTQAWRNTGSH